MSRYLVILDSSNLGRLCNRLGAFAHYLAFCYETDRKILNLSFYDYSKHFSNLSDGILCQLKPAGVSLPLNGITFRLARSLPSALVKFGLMERLDGKLDGGELTADREIAIGDGEFIERYERKRIMALEGWKFRAFNLVRKHADLIINALQFEREIKQEATEFLARHHCENLVGLHVRQGDYAEAFGGKYHYSVVEYVKALRTVVNGASRTKVLIFSDGKVDLRLFSEFDVSVVGKSDVTELELMSRCDQIVGPPSSFNQWASFIGRTPLFTVLPNQNGTRMDAPRIAMPLDFGHR